MSRLGRKGKGKGKKPKKVVSVTPAAEDVQVTMAENREVVTAASYNDRVKSKRAQSESLKGKGQPLGGAPPLESKKMRQLANSMAPRPSFGDEEPPASTPQEQPREEGPPPIPGVGSAYPVNQAMAKGLIKKPVSIGEAKRMAMPTETEALQGKRKPLSQDSIDALEAAKAEAEVEDEQASGEHPLGEDETGDDLSQADAKLERDVGNLFNYGAIQEQQRILLDNARREKIEAELEPLAVEDMIMKREIQQTVIVIPGKLAYTLRTFNQKEHLFCLQYVYDHPGSVIYNEEFLNTCKLVCALVAVNGSHLPSHRDKDGEINKDFFEKKMNHVADFPTQFIADLSVQTIWFNDRVTKLYSLENLKNG